MGITCFDSIDYRTMSTFDDLKFVRQEAIELQQDHQRLLAEVPRDARMRYSIRVLDMWWEEVFSFVEEDTLVLYHDLPIEEDGQEYLRQVWKHYGFLHGWKWDLHTTKDEYRRKTIYALLQDTRFVYNEEMVVFGKADCTIQINIHILEQGNVYLSPGAPIEEKVRTELIALIESLLSNA